MFVEVSGSIRIILWCAFLWSNEALFIHHLSDFLLSCCPTPGWLYSNDVCMSGGSWPCDRSTTKGRGHCGLSRWGKGNYQLTVGLLLHPYYQMWNCLCANFYVPVSFSGFSVDFCINEEKVISYQLWDREITCQRFDWMLQSSSGWKWRSVNKHWKSLVAGPLWWGGRGGGAILTTFDLQWRVFLSSAWL